MSSIYTSTFVSESWKFKTNLDCNNIFPFDLAPNRIVFGAKLKSLIFKKNLVYSNKIQNQIYLPINHKCGTYISYVRGSYIGTINLSVRRFYMYTISCYNENPIECKTGFYMINTHIVYITIHQPISI